MNLKTYHVGLVVNRVGLNDAQVAEIKARLKFIAHALQSERPVKVTVLGFSEKPTHEELPISVSNLIKYAAGIGSVEVMPLSKSLKGMFFHLRDHDEVWCCTGVRQDLMTSKTRAMRIYQLGQTACDPKFKLIPSWIGAQETPLTKKQKKGVHHVRIT